MVLGRSAPNMVQIILGGIQFDAEKFETRTMPTPDMKSKEMIYWIRVSTSDKRLITNLKRFLEGSGKNIDLRVPGAFVWAKAELENFTQKKINLRERAGREKDKGSEPNKVMGTAAGLEGPQLEDGLTIEIILRRQISDDQKTQSPYG